MEPFAGFVVEWRMGWRLAWFGLLALGCGATAPAIAHAPQPASDEVAAEAASPPVGEPGGDPRYAEPLVTPAPATCFEVPTDYITGCEGVGRPLHSFEQMSATYDAYARRAPSRRRQIDELAARAFDFDEAMLVNDLRSDRCMRPTEDPVRVQTTYRLARLYYAANQWAPAYFLFEEVALDPRAGELASFAANLALDSRNLQLRRTSGDAHRDCLAGFLPTVERYTAHFCQPRVLDEELCDVLGRLAEQLAANPS